MDAFGNYSVRVNAEDTQGNADTTEAVFCFILPRPQTRNWSLGQKRPLDQKSPEDSCLLVLFS